MNASATNSTHPTKGHQASQHMAIIVAENTWRLGNDRPDVSFLIKGSIESNSYGRGALNRARNALRQTKPAAGTHMQGTSSAFCVKKSITSKTG